LWCTLRLCQAALLRNELKRLVAFLGIDLARDQFLAQGTAAIPAPVQQPRTGVAADVKAPAGQLLDQAGGVESGPEHLRIRGTARRVGIQNVTGSAHQAGLAEQPGASGAAAADPLGSTTGARGRIVLGHRLQLPNPTIDGSSAHPQHLSNVGQAAAPEFEGFDARVTPSVVFRQRAAVQPHGLFVFFVIPLKGHQGGLRDDQHHGSLSLTFDRMPSKCHWPSGRHVHYNVQLIFNSSLIG
jgi:hypothetical protein